MTSRAVHAEHADRVLLVCRDASCRAPLERALGPLRVETSAAEAILCAARHAPRAVVLAASDFAGRERHLLSALRRAQPAVPVYILASAQDEPLARDLVAEGAAGYAVAPGDVGRLREMIFPEAAKAARLPVEAEALLASRGTAGGGVSGNGAMFDAACALAGLASLGPDEILEKGARAILKAAGAERASAFVCTNGSDRLDLKHSVGDIDEPYDAERSAAEQAAQTGETVTSEAGDSPRGRWLLCVPVKSGTKTLAALCFSSGRRADPGAIESLARALAHLVDAARQRSR